MKLPDLPAADGYTKAIQTRFGGYNHTIGAGEGELYDMENLSSRGFPLLRTRPRRGLVRTIAAPGGLGAHGALYWVDGTGFFYDGKQVGTVSAGEKRFASMGSRIIIFPDKAVYNIETGKFESLEARISASGVRFESGTLYDEEAEGNTITCPGVDFSAYFAAGDAVEISGCTKHPENNKTPIIRELDRGTMRFYENVFTLEGTEEKPEGYTEPGTITFARTVPDMDYLCVNENRLWGCKGDTIYCSKLGDPKNFNVFDGLGTDSFAVDAGSGGNFTGWKQFQAARKSGFSILRWAELYEDALRAREKRTGKEGGSPSQEDVRTALEKSGLSEAKKEALWESYVAGYGWKTAWEE